ncbi:MAG: cytochrome c biogenesis protein ResB [Chitinispirillaceae bacterium]
MHAGFLFLVTGGIIQFWFGDKQLVMIAEGTGEFIERFHIKILLHDFSIIRNKKGEIINYRSDLELRDTSNRTLICAPTMVNAPLKYHSLYFYQMNYGCLPDAVERFSAVVVDSTGDTLFSGAIPFKTTFPLGNKNLSLQCNYFLCDFYYDFESRTPVTRSREHINPAFKVTLWRCGSAIDSQWVFQKFPAMNSKIGRYSIAIVSYDPSFFSGIQVQKKPWTSLILLGIICVSIGLLIVFLFPLYRKG